MEQYNEVWIHGSAINLDNPVFKSVKTVEDLDETKTFEHLSGDARDDANKQLLDAIKADQKKEKKSDKPSKDKKGAVIMGTGKTKDELDKETSGL